MGTMRTKRKLTQKQREKIEEKIFKISYQRDKLKEEERELYKKLEEDLI